MLKITIELIPFGIEENKKTIGKAYIWNDATGTLSQGNYQYKIFSGKSLTKIWKYGKIQKFPRKKLNAWHLLKLVLVDALGDKSNE